MTTVQVTFFYWCIFFFSFFSFAVGSDIVALWVTKSHINTLNVSQQEVLSLRNTGKKCGLQVNTKSLWQDIHICVYLKFKRKKRKEHVILNRLKIKSMIRFLRLRTPVRHLSKFCIESIDHFFFSLSLSSLVLNKLLKHIPLLLNWNECTLVYRIIF